jgi:hypothetical protein
MKNFCLFMQNVLLCAFVIGCDMNTSVDFILEEPKIKSGNGINVSVRWEYGVPLYYFDYLPKTDFLLMIDSNENIKNVQMSSYSIVVPEVGINFSKSELNIPIEMYNSILKPNSGVNANFWGARRIDIFQSYLPDTIQSENQLSAFKNVKYVFLHITLEYTIDDEKKTSTFVWKFRPQVKRSFALWNKLMSV